MKLLTTGVTWTLYQLLWGLMVLEIALTPITMAVFKIQQRKKLKINRVCDKMQVLDRTKITALENT